jgi:hypothetical protein
MIFSMFNKETVFFLTVADSVLTPFQEGKKNEYELWRIKINSGVNK